MPSSLKILMQHRPNALTHPGGDTVVMDRLSANLRALGVHVDIDVTRSKNPREYDLVHLFNFASKDCTDELARAAHAAGVPFVVTTMYEDWPRFYNKRIAQYMAFRQFIAAGQPGGGIWEGLEAQIAQIPPHDICDNRWVAANAAALISSGAQETDALRRHFPEAKHIAHYHVGYEVFDGEADPELFSRTYGIEDYILCVGRIEDRKNQLMILKALDKIDVPVVFAGSGVNSQPYYEECCRQFRRAGKTHFINRLEPAMLASAYAGARVHVLPSWYELPGMVSIEAASYGTNVVVSDYGTIRDYLGDLALYCEPGSEFSVRQAILTAYDQPKNTQGRDLLRRFTWRKSAEEHLDIYYNASGKSRNLSQQPSQQLDSLANEKPKDKSRPRTATSQPRILVQMRPDAFEKPGGDTVAMEKTNAALRTLGYDVDVDFHLEKKPSEYDLVHLYNFATPETVELSARRAHSCRKPFVVTTLFEDRLNFLNEMFVYGQLLGVYVNRGQDRSAWPRMITQGREVLKTSHRPVELENRFAAEHASALLVSGAEEARLLREIYPTIKATAVTPFGIDTPEEATSAEEFRRAFEIDEDFVLCVGRIELRKNQLMLLKALEESPLTVVFASGGFTYQPEYEYSTRMFRRTGKTIFLPRIARHLLLGAYQAARVHALPSWYELPGLVTLEAAAAGAQVVVTDNGTIRDYVGDAGFYCRPDDETTILQAVTNAWNAPKSPALVERVKRFTWLETAHSVARVYDSILNNQTLPESGPQLSNLIEVENQLAATSSEASLDAFDLAFPNSTAGRSPRFLLS